MLLGVLLASLPAMAEAQTVNDLCTSTKPMKIRATKDGKGFSKQLASGSFMQIVAVPAGPRARVKITIDGERVLGWAMKRRLKRVCEFTKPPEEKLEPAPTPPPPPPTPVIPTTVAPPKLLEDRASKLAVMDVVVTATEAGGIAEALGAVISAELSLRSLGRYEVMTRGNLRNIIIQQAEAQQIGCVELSCLMDISRLASADHMVTSGVSQIGSDLVLTLELFDIKLSQVIRRQVVAWSGKPEGLLELSRPLVARLMDGSAASSYVGKLKVVASEEGATVRLNEDVLGESPVELDTDLTIGKHTVHISKEGFAPYQQDIVIQQNELTLLEAMLVDEDLMKPWYTKWWVWTGASVVVAGAVTAAILAQEKPTTLEIGIPLTGAE